MRRHLPVLAQAFRFYGAWVTALTALASVVSFTVLTAVDSVALGAVLAVPVFAMGAAMGGLYVAVGRGLDARRPWARIAGLVLSVLVIGDLPVGMALGIFGLGVLSDDEVTAAFANPVAPVDRRIA